MLKQYENYREELQKAMLQSDKKRAKVINVKKHLYRADRLSQEKVISLLKGASSAVVATFGVLGAVSDHTVWRIILALLGAAGVYIGIDEFRNKSKQQKEEEEKTVLLIDEVLNNTNEERSL